MLSLLHIENIAIIESTEIPFEPGFNVLTGETGAGKSIVVDAIGAVLGERTSRELIRTGAKSAQVTAVFTRLPDIQWLEENGFSDVGEELILQRELQSDGRNVCRVDGRPVTVAQLRELGRHLLNIHGQHDGQQLLDPGCHLGYLDSFGKHPRLLADYQRAYEHMRSIKGRLASLALDEAERARRVDTLTYQIGELSSAELTPGEDLELDARKTLLRNSGKLTEAIFAAQFALSGDENAPGVCGLIADAEGAVGGVARLSGEMEELYQRLSALRASADDVAELLYDAGRNFDFSPAELDQLETRLDLLYRLKKKYGATVEEMLAYLERSQQELDQIQFSQEAAEQLTQELDAAIKTAQAHGEALSIARKRAALALEGRVQEELYQLDMPKVQFKVDFVPLDTAARMDERGMDQVQFLMSANLGESLRPIQKVASGGELARIMLALKGVLAEDDGVGSMVFDEVDTGVSGRAAQKVAEKMADVARNRQVLCVTHLPQIAAMADTHFSVQKGERGGRTFTQVERLSTELRVEELVRLIGGGTVSDALRQSAQELLEHARTYRIETQKAPRA